MRTRTRTLTGVAAAATAALLLAGCSSADEAGSEASPSAATVADLEGANAYLADYLGGGEKELLITDPLEDGVPTGARLVYLDAGAPIYATMFEMLEEAADAAGVVIERVNVGADAQSINAAMNSVVESKPDAVINVGNDPTFFQSQIEELRAAGIPVVNSSVMNGEEFGFDQVFSDADFTVESGRALASVAISRTNGEATDFVFYKIPELSFYTYMLQGVEEQFAELCPDCTLRVVDIPLAEVGTTAPDRIVNDLQANPQTEYFMLDDGLQVGLPQRLSVAGIETVGVGLAPTDANLQQLLDGTQDASFATDLYLTMWTLVDQALREINGQSYEFPEPKTVASTLQAVLTSDDFTEADLAGYVAIPDYQDQFRELWGTN